MDNNIYDVQDKNTFDDTLTNDLTNGLHSLIYKRINNITITDSRIREAFTKFLKEVECDKSISVAEILYSAETVLKCSEPNENAGNLIYCMDKIPADNLRMFTKILKNSVGGIYSLFSLHNGITIDLDAIGGSIDSAETKRFIVATPKKALKIQALCDKRSIKIVKAGQLIASDQILITRGTQVVSRVEKHLIGKNTEGVAVTLGAEHFDAFASGYNSVCSLMLCNCISQNNVLRFGLGSDLSYVLARALGYFSAVLFLKAMPIRSVFSADNSASVVVTRPSVSDGDYLYLLKIRDGANGLPDKNHLNQLYYYLREKKRVGIIKDVLPVRENIQGLINRLSSDSLEYITLSKVPENCFGVIVSVARGESLNGTELGYFKNI